MVFNTSMRLMKHQFAFQFILIPLYYLYLNRQKCNCCSNSIPFDVNVMRCDRILWSLVRELQITIVKTTV